MKKLSSTIVALFALLILPSCGNSINWDEPAALEIGARALVLPAAGNLIAYESLSDFSSSTSEPKPQIPLGGKESGLNVDPRSCVTSHEYVTIGAAFRDEKSLFAKSLGGGWSIVFSDFDQGKTFAATIFSDEANSEQPLIQDLFDDLSSCPKVTHVLNGVTYKYQFTVARISENTIKVNFEGTNSEGLHEIGLKVVNQVGRNLISTGMYHYKWNQAQATAITDQEKADLNSSLLVMAQKILAESKN